MKIDNGAIAAAALLLSLCPLVGCGAQESPLDDVAGGGGGSLEGDVPSREVNPLSDGGERDAPSRFLMSSVVFGEETTSTYLSVLSSLNSQTIDYDAAREFPGWADLWVHDGRVFVADGEAPAVSRYLVGTDGGLSEDGRLSFSNYGSDTAAFWTNVFVSPNKAYYLAIDSREVVIWDPARMEITGSFSLPALPDRGAQQPYVTTDRAAVVRGERLYLPVAWGDWDEYSLSEDSVILVIDTASDAVQGTLPVACPDLNVATTNDRNDIYFSNWVYGVGPALFDGSKHTCAVRIPAAQDVVDPNWSLTFADSTEGREAAALRFVGGDRALVSVFHHEQVELTPDTDRFETVDAPNWKFWTLDLQTLQAEPVSEIDWHGGGYYSTRLGGRSMLFVPSGDYASTRAYELTAEGAPEVRWEATGWVTRLFELK